MKSFAEIFRSRCVFDDKGRHCGGTDRQSNHNYGDAYEKIFHDRDAIQLLLEIGIADGSGLLAWRDAFPNAHIVGMDIQPCACERGPRLEFHVGDQKNKHDCLAAANGRLFDAIIEDAYHSIENTLLTLFWLWPSVRPGGLYIVEEWNNIGADRDRVLELFPNATIVDTDGPFGGIEPLVVFKKKSVDEQPVRSVQDAFKVAKKVGAIR